jgi:hypothetical protein
MDPHAPIHSLPPRGRKPPLRRLCGRLDMDPYAPIHSLPPEGAQASLEAALREA